MENENYILTVGEGENSIRYQIINVMTVNEHHYFVVLNLSSFDILFGEYLGEITEDPEENRRIVYQEFLNGCKKITFVDGYMEDELYEVYDNIFG